MGVENRKDREESRKETQVYKQFLWVEIVCFGVSHIGRFLLSRVFILHLKNPPLDLFKESFSWALPECSGIYPFHSEILRE